MASYTVCFPGSNTTLQKLAHLVKTSSLFRFLYHLRITEAKILIIIITTSTWKKYQNPQLITPVLQLNSFFLNRNENDNATAFLATISPPNAHPTKSIGKSCKNVFFLHLSPAL